MTRAEDYEYVEEWRDDGLMPAQHKSAPYVLAELRARDYWKNRQYEQAFDVAGHAAELALADGDFLSWWFMTYLQGECQRDLWAVSECADLARGLTEHPLSGEIPQLAARAWTLLALALQGLGRLPEAIAAATIAAAAAANSDDAEDLQIQAQRALIAALAESDMLADAWRECLVLGELVSGDVDEQTAGKAYWVIGNVAFLRQQIADGREYHELAAENLSPSNDLDLWAKFNSASAAMRLAADIADAQTLRCIERAELATEIVGGSPQDLLLVSIPRAHWHFLTGDVETAIGLLRPVCDQSDLLAAQTAGDASFLLGRALWVQGHPDEAVLHLHKALGFFDEAGAYDRTATVSTFIAQHGKQPQP